MCLTRLTPPPVTPSGYGFVVRKSASGCYHSLFYNYHEDQILGEEQTIAEAKTLQTQEGYKDYPCGFHIWESREAAFDYALSRSEVVLRVKYRGAHTRGRHNGHSVVVAEFITLIREVDNVS